jgi:hypothetical protein
VLQNRVASAAIMPLIRHLAKSSFAKPSLSAQARAGTLSASPQTTGVNGLT